MHFQKEPTHQFFEDKLDKEKILINRFLIKEFFDRIGYGFSSLQFINILFSQIGASYFIIAFLNGFRAIISALGSSILQKFYEFHPLHKRTVGKYGIIFGLSFLFLAIARFYHSKSLFIIAFLIGTVSIVSHGDLYNSLLNRTLKKERRGYLLRTITTNGLLITMACIWLAALIMDKFPSSGTMLNFLGKNIKIYGYFLIFQIASIAFILSGYALSLLHEPRFLYRKFEFAKVYFETAKQHASKLLKNKIILTLLVASTITSIFQAISTSFYGIFIYNNFKYIAFGGFLNVAIIFILAILGSLFGPVIAKMLSKKYGKSPMLVFGTTLAAITPLTFFYNPNLLSISMGIIAGVIGASISGLGLGLFILGQISEQERNNFFAAFNLLTVPISIILAPLLSWLIHSFGIKIFFLVNGLVLLIIIAPIYFRFVSLEKNQSSIL